MQVKGKGNSILLGFSRAQQYYDVDVHKLFNRQVAASMFNVAKLRLLQPVTVTNEEYVRNPC